jgi:hypothetical protein
MFDDLLVVTLPNLLPSGGYLRIVLEDPSGY